MMRKILLSDDNELIRELYKHLFEDKFTGYEVEIFPDGNSLVSRLEKNVNDVFLVFTDNSMPPGPKGSEIIKKYGKYPKFSKIPFVLCYAGDKEIGEEAVQNGAFGFIEKPFDIEQFISIIQKALDRYKE